METFKCINCLKIKQLNEFSKCKTMRSGHLITCKECTDNNQRERIKRRYLLFTNGKSLKVTEYKIKKRNESGNNYE